MCLYRSLKKWHDSKDMSKVLNIESSLVNLKCAITCFNKELSPDFMLLEMHINLQVNASTAKLSWNR